MRKINLSLIFARTRNRGKTTFRAHQGSRRGGDVYQLAGHRVELEGSCAFYLEDQAEF
jgi:hypothetical protein